MFNIQFVFFLSAILNDNYKASCYKLPSTFWMFYLSFDVAFILSLPSILTALIETRLSIPACKIVRATLTSVLYT